MAFNGNNMTPLGGNARAGENALDRNAPMGWSYQSKTDDLASVLGAGYFDTFHLYLVAGQFIYASLSDQKVFITIQSVDHTLKQVVVDSEVIKSGAALPINNIFYVDINTTASAVERNGSIQTPFISMTEGLAAVDTPTVDSQHNFIFSPGNYGDDFTLPIFTHLFNYGSDPRAVTFGKIAITGTGGEMSINRCQLESLDYDTSVEGGSAENVLTIIDSNIITNFSLTGRGAGSDKIIFSENKLDEFGEFFATNVFLIIRDSVSYIFTDNFIFESTSAAINFLNGDAFVADIQALTVPNATNSVFVVGTASNFSITVRNSVLPEFLVVGDGNVTIARDANSVFDITPSPTIPTIINLDQADQVEYDNSQSGLNSTDVKGAVDEIALIAQLSGSSIVNGSADANPIDMIVDFGSPNLYDTTSATFVFIDTTDPLNHVRIVKEYVGETGRTLANIGAQRNIFMYMDVSQTPPVIVESLLAPQLQLNEFVSIGNFDLIDGSSPPFDEIQGVNTFVHASYADNDLSQMLHLTRGNFNVFGSEFFPDAGGNLLLDITAGRGIRIGVNSQNDYQHPDIIDGDANVINNVNMQFVDPSGVTMTQFQGTKELDISQYAPGGVLTPMPSQSFQIMYLYKFYGSNSIRAHWGNEAFTSITDAEAVLSPIGPSPQSDQTLEAQLRTALIVKGNATDLTITGQPTPQAKFIQLV